MATIHHPASIDVALAILPSLPRPILTRLVARMIERIDEIDGDPALQNLAHPYRRGRVGDDGHGVRSLP